MFGAALLCFYPYLLSLFPCSNSYDLVRDYSGPSFFNGWDFYGSWDNLTLGDVWWLDYASAIQQNLAYVNEHNRVIIKVDNVTTVPFNEKRNSIRITSQNSYGVGSLWIIDLTHLPHGCSVWPAFWSKGPHWPDNGEIDIIEGVNLMDTNQYALHTLPGCSQPRGVWQTGASGETDCSQPSGCVVSERSPSSFGETFAAAGGGVWAAQFDVAGIFIWFWSRADLPPSILQATATSSIDISGWGPPSASYPASGCDICRFFTAQHLVIDITLCGIWAGLPAVYNPHCLHSGSTGRCYDDNVVGPGSPKYDSAYFEINYVRAYTTGGPAPTSTPSSTLVNPSSISTALSLPAPTNTSFFPTIFVNTSLNPVIGGVDIMSCQFSFWPW
ncbi:concanavalin A-like lectin/glucanase domain-containing protein [Russula earlei]|uniref:Concanavalin A-like lectin/glucanase domain-containing protein n=1 Tax=Russula earlei TaxID=71964 RepID=A0ACC0UL74_9AGAM|nr:concanavalin A-like lectin/glucanase domain-containing protein [Russula earlei]